jgi:hypothetical protein
MRGGDVQSAISTVLAAARAMGASPDSFVYRLDFEKETSDLLFVCTGTVKTLYKDNAVAVVTNDDPLAITCFDLATKKKTMKVATTGKWLRQVSFAPDGSALLALSNANQLTAWEYPSGKQRWQLQVGDDPEWFHFFPDGKRVAVLVERPRPDRCRG